jgi:sensor histidine kinase YesM
MRYLLYETEKGDKPLSQEIEFMQTYIQLMKLRISEKVSISVSFPDEYPDLSIPPLLFLPFIENAFKHGISYRQLPLSMCRLKSIPKIVLRMQQQHNRSGGYKRKRLRHRTGECYQTAFTALPRQA